MFWFMDLPGAKTGAKDTTRTLYVKREVCREAGEIDPGKPGPTAPRACRLLTSSQQPLRIGRLSALEGGPGMGARGIGAPRQDRQPRARGLGLREQPGERRDQHLRVDAPQPAREAHQLRDELDH